MKLSLVDRAGIEEENFFRHELKKKEKRKSKNWGKKRGHLKRREDENKIAPILNEFTKTSHVKLY
jgi:hypothetical protein